jgi:hypothetical protein
LSKNYIKIFFISSKLILSIFLLGFFATRFDLKSAIGILGSAAGFKALMTGLLIGFIQTVIGSMRLVYILKLYNCTLSFLTSFRIWFIGCFFSQAMISFVGGDAMRILSLKRHEIPFRTATGAILLDRVIGFIALIIIFLATLPFLLNIIEIPLMRYNIISLALICLFAVIFFILLGKLPKKLREMRYFGFLFELVSNSHYLFRSTKNSTISLLISILMHLFNGLIIFSMFYLYNANVNLFWCTILSAPVLLIAMLPISFAGWGVRESAMIAGFGLLGLPSEKILAVSVTYGLTLLLGALPGIFYFLFEHKSKYEVNSSASNHLHNN